MSEKDVMTNRQVGAYDDEKYNYRLYRLRDVYDDTAGKLVAVFFCNPLGSSFTHCKKVRPCIYDRSTAGIATPYRYSISGHACSVKQNAHLHPGFDGSRLSSKERAQ